MNFLELAKARYSVRKFDNSRPVEAEKLEKIIEAGLVAPTAKNIQPFRVYVLKSEEAVAKVNALTPCMYGAPLALLICWQTEEAWQNPLTPAYNSGEMDASIVCTHMMLEAWELGIGSCWVGFFDHAAVAEAFQLPETEKPVALLPLGYAAADAKPAPKHAVSRPKEELVKEL